MTQPYPSDSRCWHCDRKKPLAWIVVGLIGAWLCKACAREQRRAA